MTYMLTRKARLAPGQAEKSLLWAQNVTEKVAQVSGLPVRLQQQVFSPEVGGISWTVFAPNLSTLEGLFDKIQQDDKVTQLIDQGAQFLTDQRTGMMTGTSDHLSTVISGDFEHHGGNQSRGGPEYQVVVESIIAPGNYQSALTAGQEIAQQVDKIGSAPVLFAVDLTGIYNGLRWITSHQDVRDMEQAQRRLQESDKFQQLVDQQADNFSQEPYATRQYIYRRLLT